MTPGAHDLSPHSSPLGMGHRFIHNEIESKRRSLALQHYYAENVLRNTAFVCPHYAVCRCSHDGRFFEGQLNAVGPCFDLTADGKPLRVMMVGQEVGSGPARVSMAQRRARMVRSASEHRFRREEAFPGRNQHMKGVTSALRILFGNGLGSDYAGEHVVLADGSRRHVFDCFALINYLLCSAVSADPNARSRRGLSTATMRRRCAGHFRATLEILQPTVIVVSGRSFWTSVRRSFDEVTELANPLHWVHFAGNKALLCAFSHPSAMHPHNWGSNERMPYLLQVVQPSLERLRAELFSDGRQVG